MIRNTISDYKVNLPEGQSGDWKIEKFTVDADAARLEMLRSMFSSSRGRGVPEGAYTRLMRRGTVVMSDTPDEIRDHLEPIREATGNVLINGLGLGVVLQGVLEKPGVAHATVIELSSDVIELVGKYYQKRYGDRLTIVQADAYAYKPPKNTRYNVCWHDIFDNICTDNLPQMTRLKRKYGRICDWQGCWGEEICREYARRWN